MPLDELNMIKYKFNKDPKCPHCDFENKPPEVIKSNLTELTCNDCGANYKLSIHIDYYFNTHKQD